MLRYRPQPTLPHSKAPSFGSKAKSRTKEISRTTSKTIWSTPRKGSLPPLLVLLAVFFLIILLTIFNASFIKINIISQSYDHSQSTHEHENQNQHKPTHGHLPTPQDEPSSIPMQKGDTVIGFGADYDLKTYQQFIGSLRNSGYTGNIVIGMGSYDGYQHDDTHTKNTNTKTNIRIDPIARREILSYLREQNVSVKMIPVTNKYCNAPHEMKDNDICLEELQGWKLAWGSYFLAEKWLRDCKVCHSGQVLLVPVHSTFFLQSPSSPSLSHERARAREPKHDQEKDNTIGLDFYETQFDTQDWRVNMFLSKCKGFQWDVPLLSSAVVKGDGMSILFYLETMVGEMYNWADQEKCHSILQGDEMAMHNYLFYNGEIRAKVHPPSSDFVSLVPKGVSYENSINEGTRVVVALDGPNDSFSSWVATKQEAKETKGTSRLHSSPLQEMAMEYFHQEDFAVLSKWMDTRRQ